MLLNKPEDLKITNVLYYFIFGLKITLGGSFIVSKSAHLLRKIVLSLSSQTYLFTLFRTKFHI